MITIRLAAALFLLAILQPVSAEEIYVTRDAQGNPVFSDRPGDGPSERLDLREPNLYEAQAVPTPRPRADRRPRETAAAADYRVRITKPDNEEGVRAPDGRVEVQVDVEPGLREGHTLELLLNGSPVASGRSGSFTIETFDRGENSLSARVLDGDREVAQSPTIVFYLLRRSLLHPAPANPAPNYRPPGSG